MKSKYYKLGFLILFLLLTLTGLPQNWADNWGFQVFGLHFHNDSVDIINNFSAPYGRALGLMSDTEGNLQFYSDGITVWNKNYEQMPNGDSICGSSVTWAKEAIAIPKPGSDFLFFVFSVINFSPNQPLTGMYFSIVDMSLDNSLGDVIFKEEKVSDTVSGLFTAVYHANHKDVWIVVHKEGSDHQIYSYLITEDGLSDEPVISNGGNYLSHWSKGQMKASPDGTKIAVGYDNFEFGEGFDLFKFNDLTGELYDPLVFTTPSRGINGVEFSSSGHMLYINQGGGTGGECALFQYDVSLYNYDSINNSRLTLLYPQFNIFEEMQLAPDGKIYIAKGGGQSSGTEYLGVINYPNVKGTDCNVSELGLYLQGDYSALDMPNFIQSYFLGGDFFPINNCFGDSSHFNLINLTHIDSVFWDFGDQCYSKNFNPAHYYSSPGTYSVKLIYYYPNWFDSIYRDITIYDLPQIDLASDTNVCEGFELEITNLNYDYVWSDGSIGYTFIPESSGTYWVEATSIHGCISVDTINITLRPTPYFSLGGDLAICNNIEFTLIPDTIYDNCSYMWNTNSSEIAISIDTSGLYSLNVINSHDCAYSDDVFIERLEAPEVNLGNDTIMDTSSQLTLDAGYFGYSTSYFWEDHSTDQIHDLYGSQMDTGSYISYVTVTAPNGCIDSDTILVKVELSPDDLKKIKSIIDIYPNPCRDLLNISTNIARDRILRIHKISGEILLQMMLSEKKHIINIDAYEQAVYTIEIFENNVRIREQKLIIQ